MTPSGLLDNRRRSSSHRKIRSSDRLRALTATVPCSEWMTTCCLRPHVPRLNRISSRPCPVSVRLSHRSSSVMDPVFCRGRGQHIVIIESAILSTCVMCLTIGRAHNQAGTIERKGEATQVVAPLLASPRRHPHSGQSDVHRSKARMGSHHAPRSPGRCRSRATSRPPSWDRGRYPRNRSRSPRSPADGDLGQHPSSPSGSRSTPPAGLHTAQARPRSP